MFIWSNSYAIHIILFTEFDQIDNDQIDCLPTSHLCCQLANFPLNAARAKNNPQ